jgi:aldehyde:ferredoxin oxidoreductase
LTVDLRDFARPASSRPSSTSSDPWLVAEARLATSEWRSSTPQVDRVGAWSGSALATALVYESVVLGPAHRAPLVLAVGECVRRGLATAARTTIASVAPAPGLYAEGQVGSDLGRRLARMCDALVVQGDTHQAGAVLRLMDDGDGVRAELWSFPGIVGLDPVRAQHTIVEALGACATLCIGRAGERELPFANLAAGAAPPSFVGRGGLGAVLGRLGLKALAISAAPVEEHESAPSRALVELLTRSPRLAERAAGGTFELFSVYGARADLRSRNYEDVVAPDEARAWSTRAGEREVARKGCRGCPTPCGWVFESTALAAGPDDGPIRRGGRFSAFYALGPNLGLTDLDAALPLLAACDDAGIDAKELGAALALVCTAQAAGKLPELELSPGELWGNSVALRALIDDVALGRGIGRKLEHGARAFAAEFGLADVVFEAKGQAVRLESNLAVLLAQCVSSRGADPMRANPFSVGHSDRAALMKLLAPLDLPAGAEDPLDPAGKGRIVWWHENWMAAIDMSGFCAFSAAGLLADGVCDVDELARWIAPATLRAECAAEATGSIGERLLAAGASIATLQRALNAHLGATGEHDRPAFARATLDGPQMWPEYASLRGVDASGAPSRATWERVGDPSILDTRRPFLASESRVRREPGATPSSVAEPRSIGVVCLRTTGFLERALGKDARVELDLPIPLVQALLEIERARPAITGMLVRAGGEIVPAVYRAARRLDGQDLVRAGDELHLVVALSGG